MKRVVVLGKGPLAIDASAWFVAEGYELACVVPVVPEPEWTDSLIGWANIAQVPYVASGDYRDLQGEFDLAISIFYDRIIDADFIGRCGRILNLHNAPLPRYRGVSPINWALKNGERKHGLTIHEVTEQIDAGPIVSQVEYSIYPEVDEVRDVYARALEYGWTLFQETIPLLHKITPRPQDESQAMYHSREQDALLGERSGFTRRESLVAA